MQMDLDALMQFAVDSAESAGAITRAHFRKVGFELKTDGSEVTIADREAEEFLRKTIAERFPDHGVFGEEGARFDGTSAFRWIVDPIDGTRSFASGVPLYGILLALEHEGRPILGCSHFPELGETVVAAEGAGCWSGGHGVRVSDCDALRDARVVSSGLEYWRDWATPRGKAGFDTLIGSTRFCRTWGDAFGYILVATGRVDILADPACGAYWDYAPMVPILREAGGDFTTLAGEEVTSWSSALATNGRLHAAAMGCWGQGVTDFDLQTDVLRAKARG